MAGGFDKNREEREKALQELSDADWDERSSKIEIVLPDLKPKPDASPAPLTSPSKRPSSVKGLVVVLETMPPWGRVIVVLAIIGAAVAGGHRLGWW